MSRRRATRACDAVLSVTRRLAMLVAAGVGAGMVLAVVLARAVAPFLVGVRPTDPLRFELGLERSR